MGLYGCSHLALPPRWSTQCAQLAHKASILCLPEHVHEPCNEHLTLGVQPRAHPVGQVAFGFLHGRMLLFQGHKGILLGK